MITAVREAFVLPLVFLTVAFLGGLQITETTMFVPPSVFALVLAVLMFRVLLQSGALAADRLLSASRPALANANGLVVLLALWLASAQIFTLLIPASGLPRIAFNVYFMLLMLNTAAADPDRPRLFRSLAVTFGSAFILKFIVLRELSAPGTGGLARVLQVLLEGVTLGTLTQETQHPAIGYLAFAVLALFLTGLYLLPSREPRGQVRWLSA
jgi:hypothetical protein